MKLAELSVHFAKAAPTPPVPVPVLAPVPSIAPHGTPVATIVPRRSAVDAIAVAEDARMPPPTTNQGNTET